MRLFLIVLALLALFATSWHAAFQGTEFAHMRGAPQIERDIHRAAIGVVAGAGGEPVEVRTSGRNVTLTGPVESAGKRDMLVRRIGALPLVVGVTDDMTVLDRADPFTLKIVKAPGGAIALDGFVPNRRAEDRLLAEARQIGDGARVTAALRLAAGAPDGNWIGMVSTGLRALAEMKFGELQVSGDHVRLAGEVADAAAAEAVDTVRAEAPMGDWALAITTAPPADGYRFSATKPVDGPVAIAGHAPNPDERARLIEAVARETGRAAEGNLTIAAGMPGPAWPDRIVPGLTALARLESGTFEIRDWAAKITGVVDTDDALAAVLPLMDEDWEVSITVRNPTPPGNVTVLLTPDGRIRVTGLLPEGLSPDDIRKALPEADLRGLDPDARGKRADWSGALDALSIVLPRFAELEVVIAGQTMGAKGLLKPDFSAAGVHAALRSALGRSWALTVQAMERRPLAEITLSLTERQILISGVLPVGISPEEVLALAGEDAAGMGLTGGGEGNLGDWQKSLRTLAGLFPVFSELTGRITEHQIDLNGRLRPGYPAETVRRRLTEGSAANWDVQLSAAETEASEGDRRHDLETGRDETYRNGFWLPEVDFPVSAGRCAAEIERLTAEHRLSFADGDADLPADAAPLLNAIAAVAIRCLNSSDMRMEIGAHTASVGNDADNRALTERRAGAVAAALVSRGVRAGAIVAVGRGEDDPVATNNTPEGRAQNERIAFRWLDADE